MFFAPENAALSPRHTAIWAAWEVAYTAVDFTAAALFTIGSVMFLYEDWMRSGTWLFIVGSICFALKPTIRLCRELQYLAMGDMRDVAARLDD